MKAHAHAFALTLCLGLAACSGADSGSATNEVAASSPSAKPVGGAPSTDAPSADASSADASPAGEPSAAAPVAPEFATLGALAPNFTLGDQTGATHSLTDFRGRPVVLEWTNFECPVVRGTYDSGAMQGLQRDYTGRDVVWLSICSSGPGKQGHMDAAAALRRFGEENSAATALLLDADGSVGRRYEAKTTPHMFVIDAAGTLVYSGAIDDQKETNHVAVVLDALLAGQPVTPTSTKPYGCSVKYAD
jgi:peroxiredoxin